MTPSDDDFGAWLNAHGLAMHAGTFARNDIDFAVLEHLCDADLKELGLSIGHRRLLLAALEERRARADPFLAGALGERRQITVMFCDLVDSTGLSSRLDLDDLRSLLHAYYSSCCKIIEDAGGFIARLVGDGILAYFGYPAAREDAAECAVRAGLKIIDTLEAGQVDRRQVSVRIGLATGLSVVGDMVGRGFAEHHAVTGHTPNLAARIQSLAPAGSLVIADDTRRLTGGLFVYADMGMHRLRGIDQPVHVQRVVSESFSHARFEAHRTALFECVGRDRELALLRETWEEARAGHCRVATVVGEAGIGKSRLLRSASEAFSGAMGLRVQMQCSPHQASTPLHPVIAWIRRETGVGTADASANRQQLSQWLGADSAPLDLALMADLLGVPVAEAEPLGPMPPDRKRQHLRDMLLRHFVRHAGDAPVLLLFEDSHWIDGATRDFLKALFQAMDRLPFLALVTSRPDAPRDWGRAEGVSEVALEPLSPADAEGLIRNACRGLRLPPAVVSRILAKTDGVPLFIEELTATVLESGMLREQGGALVMDGPLPTLEIPSTLRDSLMARLDRLGGAKEVARVGSALGREFSFALLAQVMGQSHDRLATALDSLVDAQLLFRRGEYPEAEFVFKHALLQQAAYEGQLRGDRQALHARIVGAIERHQPEMARLEPGLLAHHCQQADLREKEAGYLYAAGLASTRMVAIPEALSYFTRAESTIDPLERTPLNVARHIDIILGMMEVGRFAILPGRLVALGERARELSRTEGVSCDAATTAAILFQEGRAQLYTSRYGAARQTFEAIRRLGRDERSTSIELKPASAYSMNLCCQGLFGETLEFINEGNVGHYKETGSFIDYISGLGWIGYAYCQAGSGADGLRYGDLSVREAENVHSQIYLGGAYIWRSHAMMAARRYGEAVEDAQRCVDVSRRHSVPYLGWHGLVFLALCQSRGGDFGAAAGSLAQARGLLAQVEDGQWSLVDYLPAIEAEMACFSGDLPRALAAAERAIEVAVPLGGYFTEAMAWRVKAVAGLLGGASLAACQAFFDNAMRLHETGCARAEQAFGTLVWAHALQQAGYAEEAARWVRESTGLARRHGFALARCEYGAAAML